MRSFFQQEPGFCLRLLRGLAAFFFWFRAKSQLYNHIMSDRLTIISRYGRFLRWEIVGRYCWRTLPYKNRGCSTGHDISHRRTLTLINRVFLLWRTLTLINRVFLLLLRVWTKKEILKTRLLRPGITIINVIPIFQKYTPKKPFFFTLFKGCKEVFW